MTTPTAPRTFAPIGGLRRLWEGWKRVARRIGDAQARFMLTVFYFVIMAPFALAVRTFSDPMRLTAPPAWLPKEAVGTDVAVSARRQY